MNPRPALSCPVVFGTRYRTGTVVAAADALDPDRM